MLSDMAKNEIKCLIFYLNLNLIPRFSQAQMSEINLLRFFYKVTKITLKSHHELWKIQTRK